MNCTLRISSAWIFLLAGSIGIAQEQSPAAPSPPEGPGFYHIRPPELRLAEATGGQQDPAYATYKRGYALILNEQWNEARKHFAEVMEKFPKSEYRNDAAYWSAYALRHIDRKKAIQAYERFLEQYTSSNRYYDDAVADLAALEADAIVSPQAPDSLRALLKAGRAPKAITVNGFHPDLRGLEHSLRQMGRNLRRGMNPIRMMRMPMVAPMPRLGFTEENMSPQTRLKADALAALGDIKEDEKSYQTLREVSLDRSEELPLRMIAIHSLMNFRKYDVLSVFVEVARKDTSPEIQSTAIMAIGEASRDKDKSVQTLVELFNATPRHRNEQLETIIDAVAEIGNDRALNFLGNVARKNDYGDIQTSAIDYIGQIGKDKNKSVELLTDIYVHLPTDKPESRATVLYTVADIGNDKAVDFLIKTATSDANYDLRSDAVYYLGNIGGEKARSALYEILKGK